MTREELLELAALDAFGLLDEYETALYTRSFHHAPVAVQDQVRILQAEVASDLTLLPEVGPAPSLRDQVLETVAKAIEAESEKLAPLAMIGHSSSRRTNVADRVRLGTSGQMWRAAAFVLAGVVLVVLYFGQQRAEQDRKGWDLTVDLLAQDQLQAIALEQSADIVGPDLMEFLEDASVKRIMLRGVGAQAGSAFGIVFVNESTKQAFLLAVGLPAHTKYDIEITDDSGTINERTFTTRNALVAVQLGKTAVTSLAQLSVTIRTDTGSIVMSSA